MKSLFTPRSAPPPAPVNPSPSLPPAQRGSRLVPEPEPVGLAVKEVDRAANDELQEWPKEPRIVTGPKGVWFYDARGLFFRRVGSNDGRGYTYECQRFGPRAVYAGLSAADRKKVSAARNRERKRLKKEQANGG